MNLRAIGCNFRTAAVAVRERLALAGDALDGATVALAGRFGAEAAVLSTCNRVEVYLADPAGGADAAAVAAFLGDRTGVPAAEVAAALYEYAAADAVRHLCRVAASLD